MHAQMCSRKLVFRTKDFVNELIINNCTSEAVYSAVVAQIQTTGLEAHGTSQRGLCLGLVKRAKSTQKDGRKQ